MQPRGVARVALAGVPCLLTSVLVARWGTLDDRPQLATLTGIAWVVFALCAWWLLHDAAAGDARARRWALVAVVVVAAGCQLPGVFAGQHISNDAYRYVWDGRVQLSGTSPYRYAPLDDHLARLRDPYLFPGLSPHQSSGFTTVNPLPSDKRTLEALAKDDTRTRINRPKVPTIYPPGAQAWFALVALVTPWSWGTHGLQIGSAALSVLATWLLGRWFARRDGDVRKALLWGWCPTVIIESSLGAHVDVVAAVLLACAVIVFSGSARWRRLLAGVLLGLAVATKLTPAILLPAFCFLRRSAGRVRDIRTAASAVVTAVATYVPHVIAVGVLVLGFLPGYLTEEGFDDGSGRYAVLGLVLPDQARRPAAVLLGVLLVALALWRTDPAHPERTAVWLFGCAELIGTPGYPWYCLTLVALAVLADRLEWLAVAAATYPVYALYRVHHLPGFAFAAGGLVVLAVTLLRARQVRRGDHLTGLVDPEPGLGSARALSLPRVHLQEDPAG